MPWQTIPGITGKIYIPETVPGGKKHPCADCFDCQNCSRQRCRMCRKERAADGDRSACTSSKEVLS
jgi:hypothetical protein